MSKSEKCWPLNSKGPEPRGWLVRPITELGGRWAFWERRFNLPLEKDEEDLPRDLSNWEIQSLYTHYPYAKLLEAVEDLLMEIDSSDDKPTGRIAMAIEDLQTTLRELEDE